MLKFDEICELIRLVGSSGVTAVDLELGDARLRIKGRPAPVVAAPLTAAPAAAPGHAAARPTEADDAVPSESLHVVTSPIVGTFYRAPNPDADPFVKNGEAVEKGQVLCIVEAMKLMNEIECDVTGTIVKVFVDNAAPVEYGQPLFAVRLN